MTAVEGFIDIACPIERVFDTVADERNEPRYNRAMLSAKRLTGGAIGVGTRFKATHVAQHEPIEMIVEFTEYDRPRRLASTTTMPWGEMSGVLTFDETPTGTRMHWAWDVRPRGVARWFGPVIALVGRRSERECWEGLKAYLEAGDSAQ